MTMRKIQLLSLVSALTWSWVAASGNIPVKMEEFHSLSPDLVRIMKERNLSEQDLWSNQEFSSREWRLPHRPLEEFDRGVRQGFWRDMHRYPTLARTGLMLDWSGCRAIRVTLESLVKSNNIITLGFRSDNPDGKGRSYYCFEIPLNFTGKRSVEFELAAARPINRPAGWNRLSGIYLFAKAGGHHPAPCAAMRLLEIEPLPGKAAAPAAVTPELFQIRLPDRPSPNLNHSWSEDSADGPVVTRDRFISYGHHNRTERDLYAYYPRYNPGYVSFSPSGRAYITARELIQFLDDEGRWQAVSLRPHLEAWAKQQGYAGLYYNWGAQGGDPVVRFDRAGNAYCLAQVEALNRQGKRYDWRTRTALLLFSPDHFRTFKVYQLPHPIASFEKIDGNNPAALERPPVILLSSYGYFDAAYRGLQLLLPERTADGLKLGEPVEVAETAIGCNYHSGDGNIVLSSTDKLFVIWGWLLEYWPNSRRCRGILEELKALHPGETGLSRLWTVDNLAKTRHGRSLPASFPGPEAPARNLRFDVQYHHLFHSRFLPVSSRNGVPTFLTVYDRKTGRKSAPVYLGSAGSALDGHNWGAISFDPQGRLEVIVNGHHNPPLYTRSKQPYSAEAFEPVRFLQPEQGQERCSYGSLNCGTDGTLYSFHRSTTGLYNNRLVMFRKKPGKEWESARTIVAPSKMLYHSWMHKVAINPHNNALYLTYFAVPPQSFWPPDYFETMRFHYPELEETIPYSASAGQLEMKPVRHWESWEAGGMVQLRGGEPVILVSRDGGDSWRLARTGDFR